MGDPSYVPAAGRDWLLPLYDPFTRLVGTERFHRRLLEQAAVAPGARVLEIGCGTGSLSLLAKRLHPRAEVTGIDPDPNALARAGWKAGRRGLTVHFERAYAERLPFGAASFDIVLSALMLHHLASDKKLLALREARRVLTPGGSLHLVDFAGAGHAGGLHAWLARLVHVHHGETPQGSVRGLMDEAGFADAQETAQHAGILGRIAYYEAVAPTASPPAAI